MSKQRIFIAGHRGMVGSAIRRQLEQRGDVELVLRTRADTAFASGDAGIHFELRAKPARDVMKTHLVIDGQELEYFNQKERWQRFNWPDEQWQPGASLELDQHAGNGTHTGGLPGKLEPYSPAGTGAGDAGGQQHL